MKEKPIYEKIRARSISRLEAGDVDFDNGFHAGNDNGHRGYVLQISFEDIFFEYEDFVSQFSSIEPGQDFTCRKDLHSTVFEYSR